MAYELKCVRRYECSNYNIKCKDCSATSDIYNHYPYYKKIEKVKVRYGIWKPYWDSEWQQPALSECSVCKHRQLDETNYCPNCGAVMERSQKMLKYYCDMCDKPINMNVDGVTLLFNAQGMSMRNAVNEDKHLCSDCCSKVKAFIRNSAVNK